MISGIRGKKRKGLTRREENSEMNPEEGYFQNKNQETERMINLPEEHRRSTSTRKDERVPARKLFQSQSFDSGMLLRHSRGMEDTAGVEAQQNPYQRNPPQ